MINSAGVQHSGVFIPEVWSGKLQVKYYEGSAVPQISNTDYEGEIKGKGDIVHIRTVPDGTIHDYDKGQVLQYEELEGDLIDLEINKANYFACKIDNIDKYQSDIPMLDKWSEEYSEKMKLKVDTTVLGTMYADCAAENTGNAAGVKTGDLVLGTDAAPVTLTSGTVIDYILMLGEALDQQNVPETGRWLLLTPRVIRLLKGSDIKDASITGDGMSVLRNGRVGAIDRFQIFSNNHLPKVGANWKIMAGHRDALTFAMQITEMDHLPKLESTFGQAIRGLQVYGYEVVKPEALVVGTIA